MLLIAAMLRSPSLREFLAETERSAGRSDMLGWTGVALCVLGFGLAILARWQRAQLGHADVSQGTARTGHQRALRIHTSSNLHGIDFGDARFRDWRKHFLGGDAGAGLRVFYLQCSTRGSRYVAAIPGAVHGVYGAYGDACAAAVRAELKREAGLRANSRTASRCSLGCTRMRRSARRPFTANQQILTNGAVVLGRI
jgi:hypothetical protein